MAAEVLSINAASDRVPPHDLGAERAVLSAVVLNPESFDDVSDLLRADRFHSEAHRWIYTACADLREVGRAVDTVTVLSWLREKDRIALVGMPYFIELLDSSPAIMNARDHAQIVHDTWRRRQFIVAAHECLAQGYAGTKETQAALTEAAQTFADLATASEVKQFERVGPIVKTTLTSMSRLGSDGRTTMGMATGFDRIDRLMGGLHDGDLTIIAARPGTGKSAMSAAIGVNVASVDVKAHVGLFSLEMPKDQLGQRIACAEARVSFTSLRTGMVSAAQWVKLGSASEHLNTIPLWIDDTASLTLAAARSKLRKIATEAERHGERLRLAIFDYLQLMDNHMRDRSREQEVSGISRGLKAIAKDFGIPVIALSQLNRASENRADKRPQMSDLRESGAIEQDADNILFIYREEYYKKDSGDRNIAEINIAKQRNGPTGTVKLRWDGNYMRFDNIAEGEFEEDARVGN